MRPSVDVSTRFVKALNAHQVGLLVTIGADKPVERPPINVALVLDRSGSMAGEPLQAAREAALRFARHLSAADRLSVVIFDNEVATVFGPAPAGDPLVEASIRSVVSGGSTNLSGGWLKGRGHVASGMVTGTNRVILLTDGQANAGITGPDELAGLTRGAQAEGVSTTTIGFGPDFNEDLLKAMSDAGRGNAWYVETADQMGGIFDEEVEGLVALAAQNVEVTVRLSHPRVQGVTVLQSYPTSKNPEGNWIVTMGDLLATSPLSLGLLFHVDEVSALGDAELGQVTVRGDFLVPGAIEHRVMTMPVTATLDGTDHVKVAVERTLVRYQVAKTLEDAVREADGGDFDTAATLLREAVTRLSAACPEALEEIDDLRVQEERLRQRQYDASDRKYNMAVKDAMMMSRSSYADKIRRRR